MRDFEISEDIRRTDSEDINFGQISENERGKIINKLIPWNRLELQIDESSGGDS